MHIGRVRLTLSLLASLVAWPAAGQTPLGTAFTYQGRLDHAGAAANGYYDLELRLFDDSNAGNQVGSSVLLPAVEVTNGLFTVTADFGTVFNGARRWLQISVQPAKGEGFTVLAPRQELTAAPHAAFSLLAADVAAGSAVKSLNAQTGPVTLAGTNGLSASAAGGTVTVTSNATPDGTAGAIVSRDAQGGFAAGRVGATSLRLTPLSGSQPPCVSAADVGTLYFDADTDDLCVCRDDGGNFNYHATFDGTAAGCN